MKRVLKVLKVISTVVGAVVILFFVVGSFVWGIDLEPFQYGRNDLVSSENLDKEGPFVFEKDSLYEIQYINGNEKDGYSIEKIHHLKDDKKELKSYYYLDNTSFSFVLEDRLKNEPDHYKSAEKFLVHDKKYN